MPLYYTDGQVRVFREIFFVDVEKNTKTGNTLCGQNKELTLFKFLWNFELNTV
jgi:hypothetical protein